MSHDRGCPCGKEPYEYEDCEDEDCIKKVRDRSMNSFSSFEIPKQDKKYVWIREGCEPKIVDSVLTIFSRDDFDSSIDKFYELGPEVEVKVSVMQKGTVYR